MTMKCDNCGKEIHFGDDFYYKMLEGKTKHFCSAECFASDKTDPTLYVYSGLASLRTSKEV